MWPSVRHFTNTCTHLPNSSNMSKLPPEKLCVAQTLKLSNDKVSVLFKKTKKSITQNLKKSTPAISRITVLLCVETDWPSALRIGRVCISPRCLFRTESGNMFSINLLLKCIDFNANILLKASKVAGHSHNFSCQICKVARSRDKCTFSTEAVPGPVLGQFLIWSNFFLFRQRTSIQPEKVFREWHHFFASWQHCTDGLIWFKNQKQQNAKKWIWRSNSALPERKIVF